DRRARCSFPTRRSSDLHDLMLMPLSDLRRFFDSIVPAQAGSTGEQQALKLLLEEINTRIRYLCEVGIGYLTLDRQSRTLSGGEVDRKSTRLNSSHVKIS